MSVNIKENGDLKRVAGILPSAFATYNSEHFETKGANKEFNLSDQIMEKIEQGGGGVSFTQAEWDALPPTERAKYDGKTVNITDDYASTICSTVAECVASTNPNDVAGASALKELITTETNIAVIGVDTRVAENFLPAPILPNQVTVPYTVMQGQPWVRVDDNGNLVLDQGVYLVSINIHGSCMPKNNLFYNLGQYSKFMFSNGSDVNTQCMGNGSAIIVINKTTTIEANMYCDVSGGGLYDCKITGFSKTRILKLV